MFWQTACENDNWRFVRSLQCWVSSGIGQHPQVSVQADVRPYGIETVEGKKVAQEKQHWCKSDVGDMFRPRGACLTALSWFWCHHGLVTDRRLCTKFRADNRNSCSQAAAEITGMRSSQLRSWTTSCLCICSTSSSLDRPSLDDASSGEGLLGVT